MTQKDIKLGDMDDVSDEANIAAGNTTTNKTTTSLGAAEIEPLFDLICFAMKAPAGTSPVNQEDGKAERREIQGAVSQTAQTDEEVDEGSWVCRLGNMARMAPHRLDGTVATLGNAPAGTGTAVTKMVATGAEASQDRDSAWYASEHDQVRVGTSHT